MKPTRHTIILLMSIFTILISLAVCQKNPETKLALYLREDWKEIPAETPVTQEHVNNPELIMYRHGPAADKIKKSHHDKPADDPYYVWSGLCEDLWALSLQKKNAVADLSSDAIIRWRTKQSGGRILRVVLGLEDDTWLVSEQGSGTTKDWTVFEMALDTLKWRRLEIPGMSTGEIVLGPSLNKVKRIGFTDLMPGGGSPECSRLDWIKVYMK